MIFLRKPAPPTIREILASQANSNVTYSPVGATRAEPPAGFVVDHTRAMLGQRPEVFAAGKASLRRWREFAFSWLEAWPADTPIREGEVLCTVARAMGLWWVNVCRIVYVVDEPNRFGFAYGTLSEHAECGEERFQIELADNGEVWYDIFAFSRPHQLLPRLGYPFVRRLQKRFAKHSVQAVAADVKMQLANGPPPP